MSRKGQVGRSIYKVGKAEGVALTVLQVVECSVVPCPMFTVLLPNGCRVACRIFGHFPMVLGLVIEHSVDPH